MDLTLKIVIVDESSVRSAIIEEGRLIVPGRIAIVTVVERAFGRCAAAGLNWIGLVFPVGDLAGDTA